MSTAPFGIEKLLALWPDEVRFSTDELVVYRVYGESDELLYVGVTRKLKERLRTHSYQSTAWYPKARRVEVEAALPRPLAMHLEHIQISNLAPLHNRVFNRRRGWDWVRGECGVRYVPDRDRYQKDAA